MTNNVGNISKKRLKKYFNMEIINSLKLGGGLIYPLSLLCIVALALIVDKIFLYKKSIILPKNLFNLIETYNFNWIEFELQLSRLSEKNDLWPFNFSVLGEGAIQQVYRLLGAFASWTILYQN